MTFEDRTAVEEETAMIEFFRAGGFPMWIVLLLGLGSLISAGLFAWRPEDRKIGFIRGFSTATVFSVLSGVSADLATVCHTVATHPEFSKSAEIHLIVLMGIAESLTPAIMGFTMLSLVWMIVGIGHRRLGDRF